MIAILLLKDEDTFDWKAYLLGDAEEEILGIPHSGPLFVSNVIRQLKNANKFSAICIPCNHCDDYYNSNWLNCFFLSNAIGLL